MLLLFLNLLLLANLLVSSSTKINIIIVEESHQRTDLNALNANARQKDVVILIRRQGVLILREQLNNFFVELIESWVTNSNLSQFENRRSIIVNILHFGSISKELTRSGLKTAIISAIENILS